MDLAIGIVPFEQETITIAWSSDNGVRRETRIDFEIRTDKNRKLEIYINNVKVSEVKQ